MRELGGGLTVILGSGIKLIGLRLLQLANSQFASVLIWSRIDLKEQICFVDNVACPKGNIDNVTADPGPLHSLA